MATLSDILSRVRLELADTATPFVEQFVGDGASTVWNLSHYPVNGTSLRVTVNGVSTSCTVDERSGRLDLGATPAPDQASIIVTGTHYRYFTDADLTLYVQSAVDQHLHNRLDDFGRGLTLANLPSVEEYPVAILGTVQALWALATDSSFDIDIAAPDGVSIPRSERYRQLMDLIANRQAQYQQLCEVMNIGLYRIEVFTLRRISKATGRYVPIYRPQEVDEYGPPVRVHLPIPTYGGHPAPSTATVNDLVFTQGDSFTTTVNLGVNLTGYTVAAQIRQFNESPAVQAAFTATVTDAVNGVVVLSLTSVQTRALPQQGVWDLQTTSNTDATNVKTLMQGSVFVQRDVTR